MTAMGNRFGIHGLEATSTHSERDDDAARISEVSRPTEVPVSTRSDFGSSCPDPEVTQTKFAALPVKNVFYILLTMVKIRINCSQLLLTMSEYTML